MAGPRPKPEAPRPTPRRPVVGVSMGDPFGIGPEVVVKALADPALRARARWVVYGMNEQLAYAADLAEIEPYWHRLQHDSPRSHYALVHDTVVLDYDELSLLGAQHRGPSRSAGAASLRFVEDAVAAAHRPIEEAGVDAIVTAPISKEAWRLAGARHPGHTELLQHRTRAKRVVMAFASSKLNVALATAHVPLNDLRNVLTVGRVFDPIDLGQQALQGLGIPNPKIAVCGLNPHAGEGGLLGDEEDRLIRPAIDLARNQGVDCHGPFPADTIFRDAAAGRYDLVVAMYHDQGLIPLKLLAFDEAVNVTLGLPIIRTSPDHGTAYAIAGQARADPGSMHAAMTLAAQLAERRLAGEHQGEAGAAG